MYGPSTTSDIQTSDYQVTTRPAQLAAVQITPPTTGFATLQIYDSANSSVSGKKTLFKMEQFAGTSTSTTTFPIPVNASFGIYCVFSGTGADYTIHFCGM